MGLDQARCEGMLSHTSEHASPVVAEPLTRTLGKTNHALWALDRPTMAKDIV